MCSALSMLSSCFAYHSPENYYEVFREKYYAEFLSEFKKEGGDKAEFDNTLNRQQEHYKKCKAVYAGSDSEGGGYNTIIEPDEICKLKLKGV